MVLLSSNIITELFHVPSVFRLPCVTNFVSNIYSPQPPLSPSFILLSALCLLWNSFLKFSVWWLQFLQQENEFTVTPLLMSLVNGGRHPGATDAIIGRNWQHTQATPGATDTLIDEIGCTHGPHKLLIGLNPLPPSSADGRQSNV